jgi:hypothetical protein
MFCVTSVVWSCPVVLNTASDVVLPCRVVSPLVIFKSGQLDRHCTVTVCPHVLRAMMTQVSDVLVTCEHVLETLEPSCRGRSAKHFFILEVCGPQRAVGHVTSL